MKEKDLLKKAFESYMPDIEKVRQNCISRESNASSAKQSRQLFRMKHIIPVTACVLFVMLAFSIIPKVSNSPVNTDLSVSNYTSETGLNATNTTTAQVVSNPPAAQESKAENRKANLSFNKMTALPSEKNNIALFTKDFVKMSKEELVDFYGVDFYPTYLPDGFSEYSGSVFGIYSRNGEIYFSQNFFNFSDADYKKNINITVGKENLPHLDMVSPQVKKSFINNNELYIGYYTAQKNKYYYAEFIYKNIGFKIMANDISEDDFIAVISSILK